MICKHPGCNGTATQICTEVRQAFLCDRHAAEHTNAGHVVEAIDAAMLAHSTPTPETPTFSDADLPHQHLNVRKGKDL